jgi:molecular chaperone GrpE
MSEPHVETPELEDLRAKLAIVQQERDEFRKLAQMTQAEFENYQKRFQRTLAEDRRYAQKPLAADLLPALDNLERALAAARQKDGDNPLLQGVAMVQNQLLDALRRHGITRIDTGNQPFDANLHEAVMQQPSGDHPAGTVLQTLEQGFMLHDRVLRPARVVVSKTPE